MTVTASPGLPVKSMTRSTRIAGPITTTLTAENLSETFGLPVVLERHGERWTARAAEPGA